MKLICHIFCLFAVIGVLNAQVQDSTNVQFSESYEPTKGPTSKQIIDERILSAAIEYQEFAPIPRVAFIDVAYPADSTEFMNLKGFALILISTFSQVKDELPLEKVYLISENDSINLSLVILSFEDSKSDDIVTTTFGRFRTDAIYLLPVPVCKNKSTLYIDFAKNRKKFKVVDFSEDSFKNEPYFQLLESTNYEINAEDIFNMLNREFPEFIDE